MHIRIVEKPSAALVIITDMNLFTLVNSLDSFGTRVKTFTLDRNLLYVHMVYELFLCSCDFNKHKDLTQCL